MPQTELTGNSEQKRKPKITDWLKKAPGLGSAGSRRSPVGLHSLCLSVGGAGKDQLCGTRSGGQEEGGPGLPGRDGEDGGQPRREVLGHGGRPDGEEPLGDGRVRGTRGEALGGGGRHGGLLELP